MGSGRRFSRPSDLAVDGLRYPESNREGLNLIGLFSGGQHERENHLHFQTTSDRGGGT